MVKNKKGRLDIVYEDKNFIVINKPPHLLTISTEDEKINTLYHKVFEFVKKRNKNNKIFIVHRLDKETSGLVLFAKSQEMKEKLQSDWDSYAINREYIAVVDGYLKDEKGTIKEYLAENKNLETYVTTQDKGKLAITKYEVMDEYKNATTLKINIETGRKNQIRVAMKGLGHPIIGDSKYGSKKNPLRRMCLHASKLEIKNPNSKKVMVFESPEPEEFKIFHEKKVSDK